MWVYSGGGSISIGIVPVDFSWTGNSYYCDCTIHSTFEAVKSCMCNVHVCAAWQTGRQQRSCTSYNCMRCMKQSSATTSLRRKTHGRRSLEAWMRRVANNSRLMKSARNGEAWKKGNDTTLYWSWSNNVRLMLPRFHWNKPEIICTFRPLLHKNYACKLRCNRVILLMLQ